MKIDSPTQADEHSDDASAADETARPASAAPAADPFAVDIFAQNRNASSDTQSNTTGDTATTGVDFPLDAQPRAAPRRPHWSATLPRCTRAEARLSAALGVAAPVLSPSARDALMRALARYTHLANAVDADISFAGVRERGLSDDGPTEDAEWRTWVSLAVEPDDARLAFELDAGFAAAVVDRMLGGSGAPPDTLRALSRTEQAVVEFLCLGLLTALNQETGEPLWSLKSISTKPPLWLKASQVKRDERDAPASQQRAMVEESVARRCLVVSLRIRLGDTEGLARCYLLPAALDALDPARNPLLLPLLVDARADEPQAHLARFKEFAPDVCLRAMLGETEITLAEMSQLEIGDVVVVGRHTIRWRGRHFDGLLEVRIGDGHGAIIAGSIMPPVEPDKDEGENAERNPASIGIDLLIELIKNGESATTTERVSMTEDENLENEGDDASALALDELLLTVHVELAARRVSLDELSRMRVGQILELGCRATDPVDLISEGRRIARGELIDIEGQLGVRITHVRS
ncbi:MAG TPA: FliM/FliN family flagellar motor switch protein [Pyrinomonadaceae bacterium]|jgi:flagellar motor switch/type III secretory pathway protein FliN